MLLFTLIALLHGSMANQVIWIAATAPFTGGIWDAGVSFHLGVDLLLQEINASTSLLPGYELKVVWQDDLCSRSQGTSLFLQNIFQHRYTVFAPGADVFDLDTDGNGILEMEDVANLTQVWNETQVHPAPVAFLGSGCSNAILGSVYIAYMARMPIISGAATRTALSDRTAYPNFFRTILPDTFFVQPWLAMAKLLGHTQIIGVIAETANWAGMTAKLVEVSESEGVHLVGKDLTDEVPGFHGFQLSSASRSAAREIALQLFKLRKRIIIPLMYAPRLRLLLCAAYQQGFLSAVYMTLGWFSSGWWEERDTDCTPQQLTETIRGLIGANVRFERIDGDTQLSCAENMTAREFVREWYGRQNAPVDSLGRLPSGFNLAQEALPGADAICMYAKMLHEVLVVHGIPLADLTARTPAAYEVIQDVLARTDFEGVQGRVRFKPGSADPEGIVILQQLQEGVMVDIATFINERFNFLGTNNLRFHFQGEDFFAGPSGAESISANLLPYRKCSDSEVLDFRNNTCGSSCPENTEFVQFAASCLCSAGYVTGPDGGCTPCPGGTFSDAAGALACKPCEVGKFSLPRSHVCSYCPRGAFSNAKGRSVCTDCPPMRTTENIASTSLSDCVCDAGTYATDSGCQACTANATSNFDECVKCPTGSTTLGPGTRSVASCLCDKTKYMPLDTSGCVECPAGMSCPEGASEANAKHLDLARPNREQQFLELRPGFWSSPAEPMSVFHCRNEARCPGGKPGTCAPKLEGGCCEYCIGGHRWNGKACIECGSGFLNLLLFPILPIFLLPLALLVMYLTSRDKTPKWGSWRNCLATTGFITLNYIQITKTLCTANIHLPRNLASVSAFWSFAVDPSSAFDTECVSLSNFRSQTIVKALGPPTVILSAAVLYFISFAVAKLATKERYMLARDGVFNVCGSILFTFFQAISSMSMFLFKCTSNPNGHYTLVADLSVICWESEEWMGVLGIVIPCILVYVIGFLGALVRTLWIAPARFTNLDFQVRWKFLFIKFHPSAYWWGIVFLAKNVFLTLAFVVAATGLAQIYIASLTLLAYAAGIMLVMPYRWKSANSFQIVVAMAIVYFASLLVCFAEAPSSILQERVGSAAVGVHFLCLVLLVPLTLYMVVFGRRAVPTQVEFERAGMHFRDVQEAAALLADLDVNDGAEFWLHMGDWEWHHLRMSSFVLRMNLLGLRGHRAVLDSKFQKRFSEIRVSRMSQLSLLQVEPQPEVPWLTSKVLHLVL